MTSQDQESHLQHWGFHTWRIISVVVCFFQRRRVSLTPEQASEFYAEHFGKPVFPSFVAHLSSGPVLALVLAGEKAVTRWRDLIEQIGPTTAIKLCSDYPFG